MTVEGAIQWLKFDKAMTEFNPLTGEVTPLDNDSEKVSTALTIAIDALEKQIPKKPMGDLNSVPHYRCPVCKNAVVLYEYSAKLPHCQWCGQKLDWEE